MQEQSPSYIIRPPRTRGMSQGHTTDEVTVHFARRTRDTGRTIGGMFREVEDAGANEQVLNLYARETLRLNGSRASVRFGIYRSQDAVDKTIRRLRERDETDVAEIDEQIEDVKQQLRALRQQRTERLAEAWKRAQKVPLREIVDKIPATA